MRGLSVLLSFFLFLNNSFGQSSELEKSLTGLQVGLFGANIYNETRLTNQISLRSEIELGLVIFDGSLFNETGFILYPQLSIQPKWYYNLKKRVSKNKNVKNNAANYLSLNIEYTPNWFVISNHDDVFIYNTLSVLPTWGVRRNFAENFNYEFNAGLGYGISFRKETVGNYTRFILYFQFKVGYDF